MKSSLNYATHQNIQYHTLELKNISPSLTMPWPSSRTVCNSYFIVHFIFHIPNCLLCILYRVFLLYPRLTAHFYMYICRILLIQLLGCHIEINACLVFILLIELFSLDVTAEALRAKIDLKSAILLQCVQFDPKFKAEGDVARQSLSHG